MGTANWSNVATSVALSTATRSARSNSSGAGGSPEHEKEPEMGSLAYYFMMGCGCIFLIAAGMGLLWLDVYLLSWHPWFGVPLTIVLLACVAGMFIAFLDALGGGK